MARRVNRNSPRRPNPWGLFLVLTVAACLGALLGLSVAGRFAAPAAPGPAAEAPPSPVTESPIPDLRPSHEDHSEHASPGGAEPGADEAGKTPATSPTHQPRRSRPKGLPREISGVNGAGMKIALTLDAGASSVPTPKVLDALRAAGLTVTFFLTGKWCERNEELVRRIHAEGHEIGNHTYSHPDLRKLTDEQIAEELRRTNEIVERITGEGCAPYFRPPYGGRDKRVLRVAAEEGYTTIYWSLDSWDAFKKGITSEEINERVLERVQGGDIILLHCGSDATADALPSLIRELHKRGYQIVKISELVGAPTAP